MKGSDKVMVELTGYQVAMIYTILAKSEVNHKAKSFSLFKLLSECLGSIQASDLPQHKDFPQYIPFNLVADSVYKAVLEPETPVLTEAQKKALELKETIAKAQQQLEELEKNL